MSLAMQFYQLGGFRTRELRKLLEDEDEISHIVRSSEKFQGLQRAVEKMLVSNQRLARVTLSQNPKFRDAKLLLAMKYKELDQLRSIIQAKQEQLAEKYSVQYAQLCLLKKVNHAEEECELMFQMFAEGQTPLADFLGSFLSSRKLHHIRLVLVKKLREMMDRHGEETGAGPGEGHPGAQDFLVGFPEHVHDPCHPVCGLTAAVVLPPCCHPPFLPLGDPGTAAHCPPHWPVCVGYDYELLRPGVRGRGPRWPTIPVRLQPLRVQQRRHRQAPR